ncbi:MAG TPA: ABC transporter substrate-binding protein [Pseudolabrys sp.]|jgi:putative ABC transport system substrate-binding protein|nr:ABC transporter substrate-binding protein [Pseudolabrys sp.]
MRRRDFLIGLGAAAWPAAARAQKPERIRRVGMLVSIDNPDIKAFQQELEQHGWAEGRNIHFDYRVAPAAVHAETLAKELVGTQPDVIFTLSRPTTAAVQKETRTIPVVFTYVIDPVGAGFIASLAHPGGNLTGLQAYEPSMVGKWLGMLKEIAPQTVRVALLGNPKTAAYYDYLMRAAEAAAPSLRVETINGRIENDAADIERVIAVIAAKPNTAMVVLPDSTTSVNSDHIVALAARHRLPAVYSFKYIVRAGGLMSYGIVAADHYRQAALYVDKILRGAKPADLPVQVPVKYETALNVRTAKAFGLTPPAGLMVAADEVIE